MEIVAGELVCFRGRVRKRKQSGCLGGSLLGCEDAVDGGIKVGCFGFDAREDMDGDMGRLRLLGVLWLVWLGVAFAHHVKRRGGVD